MYHNYKELHKAVKCNKCEKFEGQGKARWSLEEVEDKRIVGYDLGSVQKIQTRSPVRVGLWAFHLKSPTAALTDALRRTGDGAGRAHTSAAGGSET